MGYTVFYAEGENVIKLLISTETRQAYCSGSLVHRHCQKFSESCSLLGYISWSVLMKDDFSTDPEWSQSQRKIFIKLQTIQQSGRKYTKHSIGTESACTHHPNRSLSNIRAVWHGCYWQPTCVSLLWLDLLSGTGIIKWINGIIWHHSTRPGKSWFLFIQE